MSKLKYYWSSSQLYGSDIIRNAMSRDRFELLLKLWHFSNNDNKNLNQDRLSKLKPLLNLLRARFSSVYIPGSVVTIDETTIPWQGVFFLQTIYSWKDAQVGRKNVQVSGYQWIHMEFCDLYYSTASYGRSWTCSNSRDESIEWS